MGIQQHHSSNLQGKLAHDSPLSLAQRKNLEIKRASSPYISNGYGNIIVKGKLINYRCCRTILLAPFLFHISNNIKKYLAIRQVHMLWMLELLY